MVSVAKLIIVIHQLIFNFKFTVTAKNFGKIASFNGNFFGYFLLGQQHIAAIGDCRFHIFHFILGGISSAIFHNYAKDSGCFPFRFQKAKRMPAVNTLVSTNNFGAKTVYRSYFYFARAENILIPSLHFSCSGNTVCHRKNRFRRYAESLDKIAELCRHNGSFTAPRNRKKENMSPCLFAGFILIGIKADVVFGFIFLVCHIFLSINAALFHVKKDFFSR